MNKEKEIKDISNRIFRYAEALRDRNRLLQATTQRIATSLIEKGGYGNIKNAIAEFSEMLKVRAFDNCKLGGHCQEVLNLDEIDILAKEFLDKWQEN